AAGGRWRAFLAAGVSAVGLLGLSWLVFGASTMVGYAESWQASAAIMRVADPELLLRMATPYAQVRLLAGETAALFVTGALALAMLGLVVLSWRRFGGDPAGT